jgi:UDP-N-acetylglucosamine--N-acetylmuramyl-(pentapeptide) pyrophosphoryl-undecaprenol N-acetylglucosamine transferase
MRIAIVAGGTGGHIYPGIAIAEEIKSQMPQAEILFLGSEEGLEKDLVHRAGFEIRFIKVRRRGISAPFVSLAGFFQALSILRKFGPQAMIACGGYASLPAVLAARTLSIPVYLHEQNVLPGVTNRFLSRLARKVFLSFQESERWLKGIVTGNPVRREIVKEDRNRARAALGFSPQDRVILVLGGSQGARTINQAVVSGLSLLEEPGNIKILHSVGQRDARMVEAALGLKKYGFYRKVDYLYNIAEALAAADLVISRAGATAIAEFLVRGLPMVLVPFPYSAEGHQELNARVVVDGGAGIMVKNDEFTPERFVSLLRSDLDLEKMRRAALKTARPDAARRIIDELGIGTN